MIDDEKMVEDRLDKSGNEDVDCWDIEDQLYEQYKELKIEKAFGKRKSGDKKQSVDLN